MKRELNPEAIESWNPAKFWEEDATRHMTPRGIELRKEFMGTGWKILDAAKAGLLSDRDVSEFSSLCRDLKELLDRYTAATWAMRRKETK